MRVVLSLSLLFFFYLHGAAQSINFQGTVTGANNIPLPFASVWVNKTDKGTATNQQGFFHINLKAGSYFITIRQNGYLPLTQTIQITAQQQLLRFQLQPIPVTIPSDDADSIIRLVIAQRKPHLKNLPSYAGRLYVKNVQQLDGAPKVFFKKGVAKNLHMRSDRTGLISLSESIADVHTRSTDYIKERITAAKMTIDSNAFGFNSAAELHVDFYQNTLYFRGITEHGFLSPIADRALHYYRYKLIGTFTDGDQLIYVINVQPKHHNEHLFQGNISIIAKQWLLYGADVSLTHNSHMDFVDSVFIHQQFVQLNDSNWVNHDMVFRFYGKLLGFKYSGYFLQLFHQLGKDTTQNFGSDREIYFSDKKAYQQDTLYWQQNRALPLLQPETNFYTIAALKERHKKDKTLTDSLQNTNNGFKLINYLFNGYTLHNYAANSLWTFPSPYNMAFYNTVEGFGFSLFAKYKKIYTNTQHSLTIVPNIRYGFSDHVFNANVFANYIYNPFHQASVYGRVGTDFLDLNDRGTINPFINSLSTLFLGNNYIKLYKSKFLMGGTDGEIADGVLLNGSLEYAERTPLSNTTMHTFNKDSVKLTSNNPLDPYGNAALFPAYKALIFRASATFTFDQEYKITPAGKFILPNPYPRLRINYREGIPALGSNVNYDFVSVDVFQDHLDAGIYGYTAYFLSAGKFLNTTNLYYPDYNQFSGGESFFFNASLGSFHFLNFYTYSTYKPYFQANIEHNFTGYFLSHVPLLNKLDLQEIIGGSFLTQGTLPDYKEVYIGIKRTVIRLDYGLAYGRFTRVMQGFRFSYNW